MSTCNTCHQTISWDEEKRKALGTNRPLNPDGTIHMHTPGQFTHTDKGPVYTPASSSDKTPEKTPQNGSSTSNMPPLVSLTQEEISVLKDIAAAVLKRK